MTRAARALLAACVALAAVSARAGDAGPPHHMTKADGSLDAGACGVCHNDDLSLQRSKLETCTLCHPQTVHAGANEHVRAAPDAVKRALEGRAKDAVALPLAEDGKMYCGTCHLFHDPKALSEAWLAEGWLPPDRGLPGAVRERVLERWTALAGRAGETGALGAFATTGARMLRLPVDQGQLCQQCHGTLK